MTDATPPTSRLPEQFDRWTDKAAAGAGALRLSIPVVLLLVIAVMAVGVVLVTAAREQDKQAAHRSVRMVETSLAQALSVLGDTARDYAAWDLAIAHLLTTPDHGWADANVGPYLKRAFGIDASLVIGDDDRILYAMRDGERDPDASVGSDITVLARAARLSPAGLPVPATGIVRQGGGLYLAAVADLRYEATGERPSPGAVLVVLQRMTPALLQRITAPTLLTGVRVEPGAAVEEPGRPLSAPDGTVLGRLVWTPPAPAREFLNSVRWLLLPIILVMVVLTAYFLSRAQRLAGEQAQVALTLRRSEGRYRRLIDRLPDLVAVVRDGHWALLNAGGAQMLGIAPGLVPASPVVDSAVSEDRPLLARRLAYPPAPGQFDWLSVRLLQADGGCIPVDLAILLPDDAVSGEMVLVARDRRAEEAARESLRLAQEQAALADRAKGQFLANISHELRTPLNAIIGFSEILRDELLGALGNPQYRDYAVDIHEGGLHLLRLVNDLLDVARIDAGQLDLREAWIDVQSLIERCLRLVSQKASEQGVTVSSKVVPHGQRVLADEIRLKQMLLNLLTNAVRFSERGGHVSVHANLTESGDFIIAIEDQGVGMTPEAAKLALQPFGQLESGHNRRRAGAGLGLTLAKGYAEAHGGSLSIASTPGVGTIVTVVLPASRVYRPLGTES